MCSTVRCLIERHTKCPLRFWGVEYTWISEVLSCLATHVSRGADTQVFLQLREAFLTELVHCSTEDLPHVQDQAKSPMKLLGDHILNLDLPW